ncbi:hypothetical protein [Microcoleus sp. CAWBG58]|uniref:hypothetical protein n=1 Tax=Microcoleus sp. CAWBG58 TaxID=2841651 RepID=UPI0025D15E3E|nr:hypothetical protein [Microcoleus sp. CAWBG58]
MPPQVDQRGMSKVGGVDWRSPWQNLPVFFNCAAETARQNFMEKILRAIGSNN